jgi:Na+/glutamate symporter
MSRILEIAVAWAVPGVIATAIVAPIVWRKLRTRRALQNIENRED